MSSGNRRVILVSIVVVAVIVIAAAFVLAHRDREVDWMHAFDEGTVIGSQQFDLTDEHTGSSVNGSIVVLERDGTVKALLVMHVDITEKDFYGVAVGCRDYDSESPMLVHPILQYSDIDYPESLWSAACSTSGQVRVMNITMSSTVPYGCSGTVVVEYETSDQFNDETDSLVFSVAVGSYVSESGYKIGGAANQKFHIQLDRSR